MAGPPTTTHGTEDIQGTGMPKAQAGTGDNAKVFDGEKWRESRGEL